MQQWIAPLKIILFFFLLIFSICGFAKPPREVSGHLVFLGKTNDMSQSVWLSVTTAGSFKLEAQGQQVIDEWSKSQRGIQVSLSPIVSQGNGGTHFLINQANNKKLDSQNQTGGIIFPPFPSIPPPDGIPPLHPEHPIVIPPVGTLPPGSPEHPIVIPPGTPPSGGSTPPPSSGNTTGTADNGSNANDLAPMTEARRFDNEAKWNIWNDNRYFGINDNRNNLNGNGSEVDFTIGADRHVTNNIVSGGMLALTRYRTTAINGAIENRATGFNIGPYFGYLFSPKWSANGAITYGQLQNHNTISILTSNYRTQLFGGYVQAIGIYKLGSIQLSPKPLISYTHYRNPAYQFNGVIANTAFRVNKPEDSFNFGYAQFKLEANHLIETKKGNLVQPYAEAGIDYQFAQPNEGQILTGNLTFATANPLSESLTLGVRTLLSKAFLIDTSGSYLSFGQGGLDVWEVKLLLSYSF